MLRSMSIPELNPVSYVVLGLVNRDGPSTPYELKTAVGRGIAYFWQFPHSQIYTLSLHDAHAPDRRRPAGQAGPKLAAGGRRDGRRGRAGHGRAVGADRAARPGPSPPRRRRLTPASAPTSGRRAANRADAGTAGRPGAVCYGHDRPVQRRAAAPARLRGDRRAQVRHPLAQRVPARAPGGVPAPGRARDLLLRPLLRPGRRVVRALLPRPRRPAPGRRRDPDLPRPPPGGRAPPPGAAAGDAVRLAAQPDPARLVEVPAPVAQGRPAARPLLPRRLRRRPGDPRRRRVLPLPRAVAAALPGQPAQLSGGRRLQARPGRLPAAGLRDPRRRPGVPRHPDGPAQQRAPDTPVARAGQGRLPGVALPPWPRPAPGGRAGQARRRQARGPLRRPRPAPRPAAADPRRARLAGRALPRRRRRPLRAARPRPRAPLAAASRRVPARAAAWRRRRGRPVEGSDLTPRCSRARVDGGVGIPWRGPVLDREGAACHRCCGTSTSVGWRASRSACTCRGSRPCRCSPSPASTSGRPGPPGWPPRRCRSPSASPSSARCWPTSWPTPWWRASWGCTPPT